MPLPPLIDVEMELRKVVSAIGGSVLDHQFSTAPAFENADFVFHAEKLIIELKCLTKDTISSPTNQAKAENLWRRCYVKRLVSAPRKNPHDWRSLPPTIQNQFYEIRTRTIKKRLHKANRQIRETKANLSLSDYTGAVILVNNGIKSLTPPAFIHGAQLALQRDFREIDQIVFMTANLFTVMRNVPLPILIWFILSISEKAGKEAKLLERLGHAWRGHYESTTGIPAAEQKLDDMEGFWHSQVLG